MRRFSLATITIAIVAILVVSAIGIGAVEAGTTTTQSNDDADERIVDVTWQTPGEDSSITIDTSTVADTVASIQSIIDDVLSSLFDSPNPGIDEDSSDNVAPDDGGAESDDGANEDDADDETDDSSVNDAEDGTLDRALVEQYIHEAVNEERTDRGLEALTVEEGLQEIARAHSEDMAERGYFAHTDPDGNSFADRYEAHGYECRAYTDDGYYYTGGENIALTYFDQPIWTDSDGLIQHTDERELADGIVDQWINSDGHRENILAEHWNNEGIGIYVTDENRVYATQNFC